MSEELPEYQIFRILRKGEQKSIGPYSQDELVELLNSGEIKTSDLVFYSKMEDWAPLSEVFDLHQKVTNYGTEGQDPVIVNETFVFVDLRSEPGEEIFYIAVQDFPAVSLTATVKLRSPKSVVLTNWRFCIVKPKLLGETSLEEFSLEQIKKIDVRTENGSDKGIFEIVSKAGAVAPVDQIPRAQLTKLKEIGGSLLSGKHSLQEVPSPK